MSEGTKIQWTDCTHNFWRGCAKVPGRPGCASCYAERLVTTRLGGQWGKGAPRVRAKDFDAPLRWNRKPWVCDVCGAPTCVNPAGGLPCGPCGSRAGFHRRRVFSLSLGDWLDDEAPIEWLADMLDVIRRCPNLDFLLLTKRLGNWLPRLRAVRDFALQPKGEFSVNGELGGWVSLWLNGNPPSNIWLGTSVENQSVADSEIPKLLAIPAAVRFLSCEPLLGPLLFGSLPGPNGRKAMARGNALTGDGFDGHKIDQIIVGGESGPKARPCNVEWIRNIVQCAAAAVPCFVKQLGSKPVYPSMDGHGGIKVWPPADCKGGEPSEWPEDLRVRQFPTVKP